MVHAAAVSATPRALLLVLEEITAALWIASAWSVWVLRGRRCGDAPPESAGCGQKGECGREIGHGGIRMSSVILMVDLGA
jgi:hypothetical protein